MKFSHKPQRPLASMQFLVVFLMGFSHLVWLKPANEAKLASSISEIPKEVKQGERLGASVVSTDSKGLSESMSDSGAAQMTEETHADHEGLQHPSESPDESVHSKDVNKDSFATDGAGSTTQPAVIEGRWARFKTYLRGFFNKLLSFFGKKSKVVPTDAPEDLDLQVQARLLEENKLKEYLLRRHGVDESAAVVLVDKLGLQGPKPTLSLDELVHEVDVLNDERDARQDRWYETPTSRPKVDMDGLGQLKDSEKRDRAIEVQIAALREEISLVKSIVDGKEMEANRRLRIIEILLTLAERYRAAIHDPETANILLVNHKVDGRRLYEQTLDEWFRVRKTLREWNEPRRIRIFKEKVEAAKKAQSKNEK